MNKKSIYFHRNYLGSKTLPLQSPSHTSYSLFYFLMKKKMFFFAFKCNKQCVPNRIPMSLKQSDIFLFARLLATMMRSDSECFENIFFIKSWMAGSFYFCAISKCASDNVNEFFRNAFQLNKGRTGIIFMGEKSIQLFELEWPLSLLLTD